MNTLQYRPGCRFCAIGTNGHASTGFDQPVQLSDRYFSVPSLGGFIAGWTLICPRRHGINLRTEYSDGAFLDFSTQIYNAVTAEYGRAVVFEHGANREGSSTGCGTDHAHLHIVPLNTSLETVVRSYDPSAKWISCSASQINDLASGHEYLFMAEKFEHVGTNGYLQILERPQSQFFRRAIAASLGATDMADYRINPLEDQAVYVGQRLRTRLCGIAGLAA